MAFARRLLTALSFLSIIVPLVECNVYKYNGEKLEPTYVLLRRHGMYRPEDSPGKQGESYVKFDLTYERETPAPTGKIEIVLVHADFIPAIGYRNEDGTDDWCCTPSLVQQGVCREVGTLIIRTHAQDDVSQKVIQFEPDEGKIDLSEKFPVKKTGYYYMMMASCMAATKTVTVTGQSQWMNPYGYLPGELYHFLPFYGWLTLVYVLLAVFWFVLCAMNWKELLMLQNCISAVLVLATLEALIWYVDYNTFNNSGVRSAGPTVFAILASVIKKTVSRMLVLVVSMGWGVVRPSLGQTTYKVMLLGFVYFVCAAIQEIITTINHTQPISPVIRLLFIFPMAALDLAFFYWIFLSLSTTVAQLQARRQTAKLSLYNRFSKVLIGLVIVSILWILYELIFLASGSEDTYWDRIWIFQGFWNILYVAIMVAIMWLWAPNKNARRYAYHEEINTVDEDEDGEEMEAKSPASKSGPSSKRTRGDESFMDDEDEALQDDDEIEKMT
eukprot:GILK01005286.1.p1 GENE.GILK01005286.1~~GILK01005286.1.p1  ORF type:complete len:499 (+),score=74.37 GILK01005286.1:123-1619(+)